MFTIPNCRASRKRIRRAKRSGTTTVALRLCWDAFARGVAKGFAGGVANIHYYI